VLAVRALSRHQLGAFVGANAPTFFQVGYGATQGEALTIRSGCHILRTWANETYTNDCGAVHGDSGSPNLLYDDGQWYVIGVESSIMVDYVDEGDGQIEEVGRSNIVVAAGAFASYIPTGYWTAAAR
jgi:hypothetical protein